MPLPQPASSGRTSNMEASRVKSRIAGPNQLREAQQTPPNMRALLPPPIVGPGDDKKASSSEATSTDRSSTTSRIPSPLKRNLTLARSNNICDAQTQPKITNGHSRQRSAALPPLAAQQKLGHARSASAVSSKTTSTSSSSQSYRNATVPSNISRAPSTRKETPNKPQKSTTTSITPSLVSRPEPNSSLLEHLQNEFLQLSLVERDSSRSLTSYQTSVEQSLYRRAATVTALQREVLDMTTAYDTKQNVIALHKLVQENGHQRASQLIQNFSVVLRDLARLEQIFGGDDGLASTFESWYSKAAASQWTHGDDVGTEIYQTIHLDFEHNIRSDLMRFEQQLASTQSALVRWASIPPDSSLGFVHEKHMSLATSLFSQCQLMLLIGNLIVKEQRRWMENEIASAVAESANVRSALPEEPVWGV